MKSEKSINLFALINLFFAQINKKLEFNVIFTLL